MPSTIRDQPAPRLQMEAAYNGPLSKVQMQVVALLVEGGRTMEQLAQEVGWDRNTIWRWRKKPEFQAEYLRQLRAVEQQAFDYGISRRVERIAALNDTWLKLKKQIDKTRTPRTDHIYALIALQTAAAKELGQHADNINIRGQFEVTEAVKVIRFEAIESRAQGGSDDVIEGDFAEIPEAAPDPDAEFSRALHAAGVRIDSGTAQPEELTATRRAIEERGLDPRDVLSETQYRELYGREKGDDPWAI
jgi:transposase-like protein